MKKDFRLTRTAKKKWVTGFTLIELMIVVAIVAILATIAYPAYKTQILKGHRADAKSAVLEAAAREEKFFATHNVYSRTALDLNYVAVPFDVLSNGQKVYSLDITLNLAGAAPSYTIKATPFNNQVNDACYTYVIDNFGVQSNETAGGATNTTTGCW
jgi:type IV pilus assembly protein PilE